MKILEIHIYGYGKLENLMIKNLHDTQVFYGENEAGKSTIMAFIHSILFGFPTKQQNELRLEPKKGAKYGGMLILQFPEMNRVTVERVKGKAIGDVTVTFTDGTVGGEEALQALLGTIDKTLYQSIFSFNLQRIQNVHGLKGEDLGRFLFSTGSVGTERLLTVENQLQKELEQRFKPGGKRPSINEKLQEMKAVYEKLRRADEQNAEYGHLLQEREELKGALDENQGMVALQQKRLQGLNEWQRLLPIVKEKEYLKSQLERTKLSFPTDGISRLDALQQLLKPLEAHRRILQDKKEELAEKLQETMPNLLIIEKEQAINHVIGEVSLYDKLREEKQEWESKRGQLLEEMEDIKMKLHTSFESKQIDRVDTSIFMKDKTAQAEKKQLRLQERKIELDKQFVLEKDELEKIEAEMESIKGELLPDVERLRKKERLKEWESKDSLEKELQNLEEKRSFLQRTMKKEKEQQKQNFYLFLFQGLLFTILTVWGIYKAQWLLAIIGGVGIGFLLFQLKRSSKTRLEEYQKEIERLKEQEGIVKEKLQSVHVSEISSIEEQLKRDEVLLERWTKLQLRWEQQNRQYERVIEAYAGWEKESLDHEEWVKSLGRELFIREEIALQHIHTAFLLLEKLKDYKRSYEHIQERLEKRTEQIQSLEREMRSLCQLACVDESMSFHHGAFALKDILRRELLKKQDYDAIETRYTEIDEELETTAKEYALLKREEEELFNAAFVETEEEYRVMGERAENRKVNAARVEELKKMIEISSLSRESIEEFMEVEDVSLEIAKIEEQLQHEQESNQELNKNLAELNHRIAVLEEGGVYGELLHQYRQLQSELVLEAKEWAKLMTAKEMLSRTVERFKHERLPQMLKQAEKYLAFLTDGNYIKIYPKHDSHGFLIERKDHLHFDANELSQATMEGVYVALRLALVTTLYQKIPYPIIIDDSFVNFDHIRSANIIELLKQIKSNQVLFFTCHQHILEHFEREDVLRIEEIGLANTI